MPRLGLARVSVSGTSGCLPTGVDWATCVQDYAGDTQIYTPHLDVALALAVYMSLDVVGAGLDDAVHLAARVWVWLSLLSSVEQLVQVRGVLGRSPACTWAGVPICRSTVGTARRVM